MKRSKLRFLIYFFKIFLVLVIILATLALYKNVNYSPLVVVGTSMYPTLNSGEFGYSNKTNSAKKNIKRGQIILFHPFENQDAIYIKRVIAIPNDTFYLDSQTGDITINGELFNQDFLPEGTKEKTCTAGRTYYYADQDVTLKDDEYFVLGDNRYVSYDSAHGIGLVKQDRIVSVLSAIVAKCDLSNLDSNRDSSSLKVCSLNSRHYYSINNWRYF